MPKATVLIVEAHFAFSRILRQLLADQAEVEVVGEVQSALDAPEQVAQLAPDIVLVDINLLGTSGLTVSRTIKQLRPTTKVVILTEESDNVYRQAARDSGASALVKKAAIATELVACLRQVIEEEVVDDIA